MGYVPFPSEPDIIHILEQQNIDNIYLPLVKGANLVAKDAHSYQTLPLYSMDIIIMPALFVGFDGYRLGRGGGFYDRALRFFDFRKAMFVGYDWQLRNDLPREPHDRRVSFIITENKILRCYQRSSDSFLTEQ